MPSGKRGGSISAGRPLTQAARPPQTAASQNYMTSVRNSWDGATDFTEIWYDPPTAQTWTRSLTQDQALQIIGDPRRVDDAYIDWLNDPNLTNEIMTGARSRIQMRFRRRLR